MNLNDLELKETSVKTGSGGAASYIRLAEYLASMDGYRCSFEEAVDAAGLNRQKNGVERTHKSLRNSMDSVS